MEQRAEYRGQDFTIIALDVRVEYPGQSQQRLREGAAVSGGLRFTIHTRRQRTQSSHQLAHLLTFVVQGVSSNAPEIA